MVARQKRNLSTKKNEFISVVIIIIVILTCFTNARLLSGQRPRHTSMVGNVKIGFLRDRIIVESMCRRSVQFGCCAISLKHYLPTYKQC